MPGQIPDHRPSCPPPRPGETQLSKAKRTEPSRPATDQKAGFKYTNSASTNLAKKFKAIQQAKAAAAIDPRQQGLELDVPAGHARVLPLKRGAAV